jgi:hypothetical protein
VKPLRRLDPVTLLPSGERTVVTVVAKNHFQARGHMLALALKDEGMTWRRWHGDGPIETVDTESP